MYERFGPIVTDKRVSFQLFFPNSTQFVNGGDPHISEIRVRGDFQSKIGGHDWEFASAPVMQRRDYRCIDTEFDSVEDANGRVIGTLYSFTVDRDLPDGFYQYKYFVTFDNETSRWCSDACTKLTGSSDSENSAFVIGGNFIDVAPIGRRLLLKDLVIYEMMVDDFTAQYRGNRAPIEAVQDKLDYVLGLGINAIEFMPLMGVPTRIPPCVDDFDWGYIPNWLFAVENRYVQDETSPLDRIFKLNTLINTLHARNVHVIFDGVFNHVAPQTEPNKGFPYHWLYKEPADSPFTGGFAQQFGSLEDLDYNNRCTERFIFDVCKYWLDVYQFDGIRFDFTPGFYQPDNPNLGISKLINDLRGYLGSSERGNVPLIIEHMVGYQAIDDTNNICATGNWFDQWLYKHTQYLSGNVDMELLRILNASFQYATGKVPVTYIDNHDHSTIVRRAGPRNERWFKSQPGAIALLTSPGAPLLRNGQEFGEDYFLPDDDSVLPCPQKRVNPRPLRWDPLSTDFVGSRFYAIYQQLIQIRSSYPSLRSPNFYPDDNQNHDGYGVFADQDVVVFHRYGRGNDGSLERFIIAINYSDFAQRRDIPFSANGSWSDLLNGGTFSVTEFQLQNLLIASNWGRIFFKRN